MNLEHWNLKDGVILRKESFGAIIYNPVNSRLLYLNESAAQIVVAMYNHITENDLARIAREYKIDLKRLLDDFYPIGDLLRQQEFLSFVQSVKEPSPKSSELPVGLSMGSQQIIPSCLGNDDKFHLAQRNLSAPISVHVGITSRCNLLCPSCYIDKGLARDLPLEKGCSLITQLIDAKVLTISFGGGEPLLYPYLWDLLETCKGRVKFSITTNATLITPEITDHLVSLGSPFIQVSLNGQNESINAQVRTSGSFVQATKGIEYLKNAGIPFGINYIVTRQNLQEIPVHVKFFQQLGAQVVNFIRPKHSCACDNWFAQHKLAAQDLHHLQMICKVLVHKFSPRIRFTIDSSLALLMMEESTQFLSEHILPGCGAGSTFCYVNPDLAVFPCSHLVRKEYLAGTLNTSSFLEIWHTSKVFNIFREFPHKLNGTCGSCIKKWYCGGCRMLAMGGDPGKFYDEDPDCPLLMRSTD